MRNITTMYTTDCQICFTRKSVSHSLFFFEFTIYYWWKTKLCDFFSTPLKLWQYCGIFGLFCFFQSTNNARKYFNKTNNKNANKSISIRIDTGNRFSAYSYQLQNNELRIRWYNSFFFTFWRVVFQSVKFYSPWTFFHLISPLRYCRFFSKLYEKVSNFSVKIILFIGFFCCKTY